MTILRGIPRILPPQLLFNLARMGHGDMIVFADANFPSASVAACTPGGLVNCDGVDMPTLLKAVMKLLPLDETCPPCSLMEMVREIFLIVWRAAWSTTVSDGFFWCMHTLHNRFFAPCGRAIVSILSLL
jgi:hypothetical protein